MDRRSWLLDHSEHPFTSSLGITDIRLTSHFRETHLGGIFAAIHEFGHGLYERQISPSNSTALQSASIDVGFTGMRSSCVPQASRFPTT